MRLKAMNWIFLACIATALTSEPDPRPRRHLHEIKQLIANKLFVRPETNCTVSQPNQPGVRFFRIPGFNDVVIKAVPKGSTMMSPPLIEKIPPNSQIGVVQSYLGTNTLNETYNALLGAKNLFKSGILEAKQGVLHKLNLLKPGTQKPVSPCPRPEPVNPPTVEPGVVIKPPVVPIVAPTRYSYKQVNQDGSVTTWSSFLDFNQGVKVTEGGKTLPFIIDRIRKIPVQLPVPVLPDVSKLVIPIHGNSGRYPVRVIQPDSSYSYKQVNQDGSLTTYAGLPSMYNKGGPVFVSETGNIPPTPAFFEKVPVSASFPRAPVVDIIVPKPMPFDVPADHAIYEAPVFGRPYSPSSGYSYTQIHGSGEKTMAHQAAGPNGAQPQFFFSDIPDRNPFGSVKVASYAGVRGSRVEDEGTESSASEPVAFGIQPPGRNPFSHVVLPSHINDRMENVAAGVKFNPFLDATSPLVDQFAHPIPNDFVKIPSLQASEPQRPFKPPSVSGTSSFLYKHIHRDGSVTSYGGNGSINEDVANPASRPTMPTPQGNTRVFESPVYPGPFPIEVNTNAFKPSTPVSGAYSYKLLNNGQADYHYEIGANEPFPVPPALPVASVPAQGCVDPEIQSYPNPMIGEYAGPDQEAVPPSYSYTQTGYYDPSAYQTVNAENPIAVNDAIKKVRGSHQNEYYSSAYQNVNEDYYLDPKDYVYIPPERYDEIPPPIKPLNLPILPPKKFSNRFLYENFDGYNFRDENTNLPPTTPKPHENTASNVYSEGSFEQAQYNRRSFFGNRNSVTNNNMFAAEQITTPNSPANNVYVQATPVQTEFNSQPTLSSRNPEFNNPSSAPEQASIPSYPVDSVYNEGIPSSPEPILSPQNSLNAIPITVQEKSTFLFKQSNADGSSITTTNDGGNTLSVQVEEARIPEAMQEEELSRSEGMGVETPEPVDEVTSTTLEPIHVEETSEPQTVTSTALPRRRKIKRVKVKHNRGDIPDTD